MIFSELYGAYYNTVARLLKAAVASPLTKSDIRRITGENAFGESILNIEPAITGLRWLLIRPDGTTPIRNAPTMPLTTLEKRWLKAVFADPRMKLFYDEPPEIDDVEPLFSPDDISVFDRYSDGDPYLDAGYIARFRLILDAIKEKYPLSIDMMSRRGNPTRLVMLPDHLEYSEKDDKFRLIGSGNRFGNTVNLARIADCRAYTGKFSRSSQGYVPDEKGTVEFLLTDLRNALERALMHFAHFEKQAEKTDDGRYLIRVTYDKADETELVIRVLSFGPMIKVISPPGFVELIKQRLVSQKNCGL